jgi:hypothetical protein
MRLTGTSALLMHNAQLANPASPFAMAIAELTSKSDKTTQDQTEIARLEFMGGLYVGESGPMVPSANIRKTFINAAKVRREGKSVERALLPTTLEIPLQYKGPRDPKQLWQDQSFHALLPVRVGRARIMRMRPRFPQWSLESEWELIEDMLDLKKLIRIGNEAGVVEGLCDGRNQGWGRFICEIAAVQQTRAAA